MREIIIAKLRNGESVVHREGGNSMTPIIRSRQPVVIEPVKLKDIEKGDIVFCKVRGMTCCHLVTAVDKTRMRFQISNNHGHVNGWTKVIYGKITKVLPMRP